METQVLDNPEVQIKTPTGTHKLILHNDDFNELQWVINCLMDICKHSMEQAEQCAILVHHNGKCDIKLGDEETLNKMKLGLLIRQLSVTLEKN